MSENSMLAVAAVSTSAAWLAWKITARAFAYQTAKRTAAEKTAKKASTS